MNIPLTIAMPRSEESDHSSTASDTASNAHAFLPDLTGILILVVDDEPDAQELIKRVLEQQGASVIAVPSGQAALRALENVHYDLMLSDVGMPGMDGYQLIRRIRAGGASYARIPAIALTAFARAEDRKKALVAGFQSHLSKPFDIVELLLLVAGLVGRAHQEVPGPE